jgi:hypothetical protein
VDTSTPPDSADTGAPLDTAWESEDAFCSAAALISTYLDALQTPGDGKVIFCHYAGGHYNIQDINISACFPHLSHVQDVLPSTLCDS